jgi:hypothetical protein
MYYIGLDVTNRSSLEYLIDGRGKKIESERLLVAGSFSDTTYNINLNTPAVNNLFRGAAL